MQAILRWIDVRQGEARPAAASFCVLLGIVASHTLLETARDALFLTHLGSRSLGFMVMAAAGLTLVAGGASAVLGSKLGARRALAGSLAATALGVLPFAALPPTRAMLMSLYAFSAVTGALLIPQFWASIGGFFDAAQGRRLFRTIALAGILGAACGAGFASAALLVLDVRALLPVVAVGFALAAGLVATLPEARASSASPRSASPRSATPRPGAGGPLGATFRAEPILWRLAAVVALGAATTLLVDFVFKTHAAATVPKDQLGAYFARWGVVMNVLALVVQLAAARRLLDRAGVVGTASFTPTLLGLGNVAALLSGGAAPAVLGTKIVDASLRHSVQRTGVELVYMAVPSAARDRAKPFIDGAIARASQAVAAALAIGATTVFVDATKPLIALGALLAIAWAGATAALRKPYLALFRRALLGEGDALGRTPEELDVASLELLVEALGSPRVDEVVAAMNALDRRGRAGILPSVILLHESPDVVQRALELFGASSRRDWVRRAEQLTKDPREAVRTAALRAVARTRSAEGVARTVGVDHAWITGYVSLSAALASSGRGETTASQTGAAAVAAASDGADGLLGALAALQDAEPSRAARDLLTEIVDRAPTPLSPDAVAAVARAAAAVQAVALVDLFVDRLGHRAGRPAVRAALVALGPRAFERLCAALADADTPPRVRAQIPHVLQDIGDQASADALLACVASRADGAIRYRSLRALGRLVTDGGARVDEPRARTLARRELVEHLRVLGLREALARLDVPTTGGSQHALALRLLDDKARQALERAFRAIKLGFPTEDLHRVHDAAIGGDAAARANAVEFLDALLAPKRGRRPQRDDDLRQLLRVATDALSPAERVQRGGRLAGTAPPVDGGSALRALRSDADPVLSAIARTLDAARPAAPRSGAHAEEAHGG